MTTTTSNSWAAAISSRARASRRAMAGSSSVARPRSRASRSAKLGGVQEHHQGLGHRLRAPGGRPELDLEQHRLARWPAVARPRREASRSGSRRTRPTRGTRPRRPCARTAPGSRSGRLARRPRPARGCRVVADTETHRSGRRRRSSATTVPLPTPLGPVSTTSRPRHQRRRPPGYRAGDQVRDLLRPGGAPGRRPGGWRRSRWRSMMSAARTGPIPRKLDSRSTTFIRARIRPRSSLALAVAQDVGRPGCCRRPGPLRTWRAHLPGVHALWPRPRRGPRGVSGGGGGPGWVLTAGPGTAASRRAAAPGSAAAVIGRPMTSRSAPAARAASGVATRDWSAAALPSPAAGRTPGVIRVMSAGTAARIAATSCGEHTIARAPAATAIRARRTAASRAGPAHARRRRGRPRTWRSGSVTAVIRVPGSASAAAATMAGPPLAWTVRKSGAEVGDAARGPGHGVGDVVQLEVEEQPAPGRRGADVADDGGAVAQVGLQAHLHDRDVRGGRRGPAPGRSRGPGRRGPAAIGALMRFSLVAVAVASVPPGARPWAATWRACIVWPRPTASDSRAMPARGQDVAQLGGDPRRGVRVVEHRRARPTPRWPRRAGTRRRPGRCGSRPCPGSAPSGRRRAPARPRARRPDGWPGRTARRSCRRASGASCRDR